MPGILLLFLAFFAAGWVQGIIGFGFAVVTTLILVNHMDFTTLVFFNLCLSVVTCFIALLSGRNLKTIHKLTLAKLIASASLGLILGIFMLDRVDALFLKKLTLSVILIASLLSLTKNRDLFSKPFMAWAGGFFSGVLTPSTGINGPLVALHLNAAFADKEQTRNTMLSYLFLIMIFGVVSMSLQTRFPEQTWKDLGLLILPSVFGYTMGMLSFRLLPNAIYKKAVTLFLIASSISSLIYLLV